MSLLTALILKDSVEKTWSDEARAASLAARQATAKANSKQTSQAYHQAAYLHRGAAAYHTQAAQSLQGKERQNHLDEAKGHQKEVEHMNSRAKMFQNTTD